MIKRLIAGLVIIIFSLLMSTALFSTSAAVTPPDLLTSGQDQTLALWVKADTGLETIDGVSKWRDNSGKGNHMKAYGPITLKKNAINRQNAFVFKENSGTKFDVAFAEPYQGSSTIFIVANIIKNSGYKGLFCTNSVQNSTLRAQHTWEAYPLDDYLAFTSYNANMQDSDRDALYRPFTINKYQRMVIRSNATGVGTSNPRNEFTTFLDGNQMKYWTNRGTVDYQFNKFTGFMLGSRYHGLSDASIEMELAECIVFFRSLSNAEISQIDEYLRQKYFVPQPPEDGIELAINPTKAINANNIDLSINIAKVPGSVFNGSYDVIVQIYRDAGLTEPLDTMIFNGTPSSPVSYNKNYYAKIMVVSKFGASGDLGQVLAHPVTVSP